MSNLYVQSDDNYFISKYYFQKISQYEIETHLAFFFYDGKTIDTFLLSKCVQEIKELVLALECFKGGCFNSASLFICYDSYDHSKFAVKLIDFDKYTQAHSMESQQDENIITGLKYIIWYFNRILEQPKFHENIIDAKELNFFNIMEVVPKHKLNQFVEETDLEPSPNK